MQKIMFNDKYCLTQAVLEGKKTMTRRIHKTQQPEGWDIAFPIYDDDVAASEDPLWLAYRWYNPEDITQHTEWIKPMYKVGEVVAIAQRYSEKDVYDKHVNQHPEDWSTEAGWNNKMFVKPELMPHQIKITEVYIQRLQDISDADCMAEGIYEDTFEHDECCPEYFYDFPNSPQSGLDGYKTPREAYAALINKLSGKDTWKNNPLVWVYEFELIK